MDKIYKDYDILRPLSKDEQKFLNLNNKYKSNSMGKQVKIIIDDMKKYNDHYDSFNSIRIQKNLHDQILSKVNERQIDSYLNNYFPLYEYKLKSKLMPPIKIYPLIKQQDKLKSEQNQNNNENNTIDDINIENNNLRDSRVSRDKFFRIFNFINVKIITQFCNTPPSRKESQMVYYFDHSTAEKKLLLFGGFSLRTKNDLWECVIGKNMKTGRKYYKWNEIKKNQVKGDRPIQRTGHSGKLYGNERIIFYGGLIEDERGFTYKDDLLVYFIHEKIFQIVTCSNKENVIWRRNHIAEIIGNSMLIYGGQDINNDIISDPWYLDLIEYKWRPLLFSSNSIVPKLYYHCSCQVFSSDIKSNSRFSLFKVSTSDKLQFHSDIKYEGIYIFGGITEEGKCSDSLYIMIRGKILYMTKINNYKGLPPSPRCQCSMNYYEKLHFLIIFGGRNENDIKNGPFLNDFYIFDLELLEWTRLIAYMNGINANIVTNLLTRRASYCSEIVDNELIIFGGYNDKEFVKTNLMVANLDMIENRLITLKSRVKKTTEIEQTKEIKKIEKKVNIKENSSNGEKLEVNDMGKDFNILESKYVILNEELFSSKNVFEKFPKKKQILEQRFKEINSNNTVEEFFDNKKIDRLPIPGDDSFYIYDVNVKKKSK